MQTTIDPIVTELVIRLSADHLEEFHERSAIVEYDGGKPRAHAECLALLNVIQNHPAAISGLAVMEIAFEGKTRWLFTNDLERARIYLSRIGARERGYLDPVDALNGPIHGLALLRPVS
jgi:hypothetical protein